MGDIINIRISKPIKEFAKRIQYEPSMVLLNINRDTIFNVTIDRYKNTNTPQYKLILDTPLKGLLALILKV
jgi:hypothetical protein